MWGAPSLLRTNSACSGEMVLLWVLKGDPQLLTNLQHIPTVTPHLTGNIINSNFIGHSSASLCSFTSRQFYYPNSMGTKLLG